MLWIFSLKSHQENKLTNLPNYFFECPLNRTKQTNQKTHMPLRPTVDQLLYLYVILISSFQREVVGTSGKLYCFYQESWSPDSEIQNYLNKVKAASKKKKKNKNIYIHIYNFHWLHLMIKKT